MVKELLLLLFGILEMIRHKLKSPGIFFYQKTVYNAAKTATVTAKINTLTTKNNEVSTAYTIISNSRIKRDKTIYGTETGIVDVASEVKKYVKSLFGATSPEYAQISGIEFKRTKK